MTWTRQTCRHTERKTGIKVEKAERNCIRKELIQQLIHGKEEAEKEENNEWGSNVEKNLWCELVERKAKEMKTQKKKDGSRRIKK